jgi:hypothetical protein
LTKLQQRQERLNASAKKGEGIFSSLGGTLMKLGMGFQRYPAG